MIAQDFTARAQAIPFPSASNREERTRLRREYDAAHAAVNSDFAAALADEYLSEISETRRSTIAAQTFQFAWREGHSGGYSEVEWHYADLSEYALAVYAAATS